MVPSLDNLPAELYCDILSVFDPESDELRHTLLALSRAIPRTPLPTYLLFSRICLKHGHQVPRLYQRLRAAPDDAARVRKFSLECWAVNADHFVNLIGLLPSIVELQMFIGPDFAPEHLNEILHTPRVHLRLLSMRFRPYVQQANYLPFLKGAYFDSMLTTLSGWPPQNLSAISIAQDPLSSALAPTDFAQPLVFFRLDPLSALATSRLCSALKHLRIRVPNHKVCRHLHSLPHSFPSLETLDLSTSHVGPEDLASLLGHLGHVRALVLDGCPIVSQRTDIQPDAGEPFLQWMELGYSLALAGVKRASAREKSLKKWCEDYYASGERGLGAGEGAVGGARKNKRGRKGLATATLSLRVPSPERGASVDVTIAQGRIPPRGQKIRVLAPLPMLRSLATSVAGELTPATNDAIRAEFERGWVSGVARLSAARLRQLTSFRNGVARIVRFAEMGTPAWQEEAEHGEQGLAGLVDVQDEGEFGLLGLTEHECETGSLCRGVCPPLLCLAGCEPRAAHVSGCGHQTGWSEFQDEIPPLIESELQALDLTAA